MLYISLINYNLVTPRFVLICVNVKCYDIDFSFGSSFNTSSIFRRMYTKRTQNSV